MNTRGNDATWVGAWGGMDIDGYYWKCKMSDHIQQYLFCQFGLGAFNFILSSPYAVVDSVPPTLLSLFRVLESLAMFLLWQTTSMFAILWKASSIWAAVFALVSMYSISLCFSRKAWTYSDVTALLSARSHLLPTNRICVSDGQEFLIS